MRMHCSYAAVVSLENAQCYKMFNLRHLKGRNIFEILMILSNFKPKKSSFWPFLLEKYPKIHKICGFVCKKPSKFEENSKFNMYSLVPQIDHPVTL